jgi:hypothetical protein
VFLVACGHVIASPVVGNQNQYLAHVEGLGPGPEADWFVGTADPYPFFTAVVSVVFGVGGYTGLRLTAFLGTLAALSGVYLLARLFAPRDSRGVPLLAMTMVGCTLVVFPPGALPFSGSLMSAFQGLAGQYVLSRPGYLQPSLAGCLLLLALPLWIEQVVKRPAGRWRLSAAWSLTVLACMVHPTYLPVVGVALVAGLIADVFTGHGRRRLLGYVALGLATAAATLVANPAMLDLAVSSENRSALDRFAFERIPHHTVWRAWSPSDLWRLLLIGVAAVVVARRPQGSWVSRWIIGCLAITLAAAVAVDLGRWPTLALLFPWRVTVFIVPLAATILATWLATRMRQAAHTLGHGHAGPAYLVAVCAVTAIVGLDGTFSSRSPAVANEPTALVRSAQPVGVGMIPLHADDIRMNGEVPVYVDWKSPPYGAGDLAEWWQRVDRVRAVYDRRHLLCTSDWEEEISWVLWSTRQPLPWCLADWRRLATSVNWRLLQRTPEPAGSAQQLQ